MGKLFSVVNQHTELERTHPEHKTGIPTGEGDFSRDSGFIAGGVAGGLPFSGVRYVGVCCNFLGERFIFFWGG